MKVGEVVEDQEAGVWRGFEQIVPEGFLVEIPEEARVVCGNPDDVLEAKDSVGVPEGSSAFPETMRCAKKPDCVAFAYHLRHQP